MWLVAFTTLAVAQPRPLVVEDEEVLTASDVAYTPYTSANPREGAPFFGDAVATRGGDTGEFGDFVAYQLRACPIRGGVPRNVRGLPI
jgi:hypothetical protein